jgi:ATP-dependent protease ClpP protease subunit
MLIIKYFIIIFLIIYTSNVNSINLSLYGKIINWYEQTQNLSCFDSVIYFDSYITQESGTNLITRINHIINDRPEIDVFIVLDTDGGDLLMTYKIISHMDLTRLNYGIKYHCVSIKAYSSGFFIFQLCDYRYWIDGTSIMMIHEPKLKIEGTFRYVKKYIDCNFILDYKNYQSIINRICSKSNINISEYQNKIANKDWIISSEDEVRLLNFTDFYFTFI